MNRCGISELKLSETSFRSFVNPWTYTGEYMFLKPTKNKSEFSIFFLFFSLAVLNFKVCFSYVTTYSKYFLLSFWLCTAFAACTVLLKTLLSEEPLKIQDLSLQRKWMSPFQTWWICCKYSLESPSLNSTSTKFAFKLTFNGEND